MSTKCIYCNTSSHGGTCARSPHKAHEHNADEKHCVFCGATSYGSCAFSPIKIHKHGKDGKKCVYCGSTSSGSCSRSPHGKHEK